MSNKVDLLEYATWLNRMADTGEPLDANSLARITAAICTALAAVQPWEGSLHETAVVFPILAEHEQTMLNALRDAGQREGDSEAAAVINRYAYTLQALVTERREANGQA